MTYDRAFSARPKREGKMLISMKFQRLEKRDAINLWMKRKGSLNFSKSSESLHEKCDDFVKNIFFPIVLRKNCRIISFSSPSSFQRIIKETVDDLL